MVSQEDFGKSFRHRAIWNRRLRTTGGRFFPEDGHLDFNPKLYEQFGEGIFRKIVRHELVHYHLYFAHKGYRHRDKDFKDYLKQVDGLRYTPPLITDYHRYRCQSCKQIYQRRRRINTQKYACGKCQGRLEKIE